MKTFKMLNEKVKENINELKGYDMRFVLGYDLLHDQLNNIECDLAYKICCTVYAQFLLSEYNILSKPEYDCLNCFIEENREAVLELIEQYEKLSCKNL